MKILVVEDDAALTEALQTGLRQHGFEVAAAATFQEGWTRIVFGSFAVVVLDVMLPGGTGIELCRRARQKGITTPVLLLTARDAVEDRVYGLESGADDYVIKPFAFEELVARIHALTRRPPAIAERRLNFGDLTLDVLAREVRRGERRIELTAKEFALLELFMTRPGKLVDRALILSHVWDENYDPASNTVEVLVRRLREKVDDPAETKLIATIRGAGYRFGA